VSVITLQDYRQADKKTKSQSDARRLKARYRRLLCHANNPVARVYECWATEAAGVRSGRG
jgi:hypothetical protein